MTEWITACRVVETLVCACCRSNIADHLHDRWRTPRELGHAGAGRSGIGRHHDEEVDSHSGAGPGSGHLDGWRDSTWQSCAESACAHSSCQNERTKQRSRPGNGERPRRPNSRQHLLPCSVKRAVAHVRAVVWSASCCRPPSCECALVAKPLLGASSSTHLNRISKDTREGV